MEDFVHDYFSGERFRNAYKMLVVPLGDKSFCPKVDIASEVGAPLTKRSVGQQRKNRIKSCLEGGSSSKKQSEKKPEGTKVVVRGSFKCPN